MSQYKLKSNFREAFEPTLQSFSIIGLGTHTGTKDSGCYPLLIAASLDSHPTAQGTRFFVTDGYIDMSMCLAILQQLGKPSFPLLIQFFLHSRGTGPTAPTRRKRKSQRLQKLNSFECQGGGSHFVFRLLPIVLALFGTPPTQGRMGWVQLRYKNIPMFGLKLHKFFIPNFPGSRPSSLLCGILFIMTLRGNLVLMTSVLSLVWGNIQPGSSRSACGLIMDIWIDCKYRWWMISGLVRRRLHRRKMSLRLWIGYTILLWSLLYLLLMMMLQWV
mmetsp:Transcript_26549/g.48168  ORF Transcript_26549/g.48168 Transcript_26549/m.48168 type:complete len:273 (+) Transcript_26549:1807-2625(+)